MRTFKSLSEREILALAISLEEEDARVYEDMADGLKESHPTHAERFRAMRQDEDRHRHLLLDLYRGKFGEHIPLIRRQDVKGFVRRNAVWLLRPLRLNAALQQAETMELETRRFYEAAARQATDVSIRQLLGDLAEEERKHSHNVEALGHLEVPEEEEAARRRLFVLQVVQPGLAGLMDGSVSTLAPLFAAAFAALRMQDPHNETLMIFRVGLAASVGAGISMGFAEALSDDGSLTGRGRPLVRGIICGIMTAIGGLGHTLPYLIPHWLTATLIAVAVVVVELIVIAWIRNHFMDTPLRSAVFQVVVGGVLVFLAGILIGAS
jgi:rubrerythrin